MTTENETTVAKTTAPETREIVEQTVTKEFEFNLTENEYKLRAREISAHRSAITKEEAAFKERKAQNASTITGLENKINNTLTILSEGKETRTIECTMTKHFNEGLVRYTFEGRTMEERPLTTEERQLELGPQIVKGRTQTADAAPNTDRPADNEIAQAIREETSARSKHSSVDGPLGAPGETL